MPTPIYLLPPPYPPLTLGKRGGYTLNSIHPRQVLVHLRSIINHIKLDHYDHLNQFLWDRSSKQLNNTTHKNSFSISIVKKKTKNTTLFAIVFNPLFLVPFCSFYLCSSLSLSLRLAQIWPSLWYPGKLACFHDNVFRQNSVFVLSWIRSESVSSLLDTLTPACRQTHTVHTTWHICTGETNSTKIRKLSKLNIQKQTNDNS